MKLIIGLGNPGKQYENTRHNAGFIVLDELAKTLEFENFQNKEKFHAQICEKNIGQEKIIFAKPQTFMNRSGQSAEAISSFYKIAQEDIVVLHDDLDIELGKFKISTDSSAAGHNGIQSIFDTFNSQQIKRVRIGIEGAEKKLERKIPGDVFVLQPFSNEELEIIKNLASEIQKELL